MLGSERVDGAGRRVLRFEAVPSTQDVIREEARAGAPAGTVAIAAHQTAGRGRRGRTWLDPARGMLMLSYLARPTRPAAEVSALALVAGLAVAESLPCPTRLRWPNDIVVDLGKVAGILLEGAAAPTGRFAIIGIGINVNVPAEDLPPTDRLPAASILTASGATTDIRALEIELLNALDRAIGTFDAHGFAALRARFEALDDLIGRRLVVRTPNGPIEGHGAGVDDQGRLRVRDDAGTIHVLASAEVERVAATDDATR